jgi:cell division protein FtsI/penicillin-binding protein 2
MLSKLIFILRIAFFSLFVLAITPQTSYGQKAVKKAEKNKEKQKKSQEEVEEELMKRHLKIQDRKTRVRMKNSAKMADRRKRGLHPEPWFHRIFKGSRAKRRSKTS